MKYWLLLNKKVSDPTREWLSGGEDKVVTKNVKAVFEVKTVTFVSHEEIFEFGTQPLINEKLCVHLFYDIFGFLLHSIKDDEGNKY